MKPSADEVAPVDFDLHGLVRIRVLSPRPDDVQRIQRQIGPLQSDMLGNADITIRFVDRIDDDEPITYVGWQETGFTSRGFYLLRGRAGVPAKTALAFDRIGHDLEIVCERAAGHVPHLLAIINLVMLSKGKLPLHATAFSLDGRGVLVAGWSKGGKTETLLAMSEVGARYIGDEWIYLSPDGGMLGLPEPIRLWKWHVDQLPAVKEALPPRTRAKLVTLSAVARIAEQLGERLPAGGGAASIARRAAPIIRRQAYTQRAPLDLFGVIEPGRRFDAVILALSTDAPEVRVEPISGEEVATRMRASLLEEREALLAHYRQFLFAFPDRRSQAIDAAQDLEANLLGAVLSGRAAYKLRHPYPFEIRALVAPVRQLLLGLDMDTNESLGSNAPEVPVQNPTAEETT